MTTRTEPVRRRPQRAIDILKKCDLQVKVLRIPGAKDPDEFIKARGADAFRNLIERSEEPQRVPH